MVVLLHKLTGSVSVLLTAGEAAWIITRHLRSQILSAWPQEQPGFSAEELGSFV